MATVSVRYIVDDVSEAIAFHTKRLGFGVEIEEGPADDVEPFLPSQSLEEIKIVVLVRAPSDRRHARPLRGAWLSPPGRSSGARR